MSDSICQRCGSDNLTDYPVCPTCRAAVSFTSEPAREIVIERRPAGHYEFRLPFAHAAFLAEFEKKVGKPFRCWHIQRQSWQIRPLDDQMIDFIADIVRAHFKGYAVRIEHGANEGRIAA